MHQDTKRAAQGKITNLKPILDKFVAKPRNTSARIIKKPLIAALRESSFNLDLGAR